MQLVFSMDELKLMAALLENREQQLVSDGSVIYRQSVADLLDKVITRDLRFSFDELEELTDVLNSCDRQELVAVFGESTADAERQLLTRVLDRLTEAQAMA